MATYIALLRGINVGGKNKLSAEGIRKIFEACGATDVQVILQSGNVVFDTEEPSAAKWKNSIEKRIRDSAGFETNAFVLNADELLEALRLCPFAAEDGKQVHVFFLGANPSLADMEGIRTVQGATEEYRLSGRFFYLFTPDGFGRSKLASQVERLLSVPATARNLNTVNKLARLIQGAR